MLLLLRARKVEMDEVPDELVGYDEAMVFIRGFIAGTWARDRFEDNVWSRWRKRPQFLSRVRGEMEAMGLDTLAHRPAQDRQGEGLRSRRSARSHREHQVHDDQAQR